MPDQGFAHLALRMRRAALELRYHALRHRKFDPGQPRVPAGNSEGGQWTDGGGGATSPRGASRREEGDVSGPVQRWRRVRAERTQDGTGERIVDVSDDGIRIVSERRRGIVTGAETSRHLVTLPDGAGLHIDNDHFGIQRIRDETGELLSAARWGKHGPEILRDFSRRDPREIAVEAAIRAGIAAWNWLNARSVAGTTPVLVFQPRQFRGSANEEISLETVGEIERDEADKFCKRYPEVRNKLSDIARQTRVGFTGSAREFGSKVHYRMAKYVNDQGDRNFKAKVTHDESSPRKISRRRTRGSTFLDVYERASRDTVCVYDHKTGRAGLSEKRALRLAATARKIHGGASRVVVIEVRPGL